MFVFVRNGVIVSGPVQQLPEAARRLDTGEIVLGLRIPGVGFKWRNACGWFDVVPVSPPTVDDGEVAESTVVLSGRVARQVWTVRPKTPGEVGDDRRAANRDVLTALDRAQQALTANADYLALPSPTAVDAIQQVGRLTRQMSTLIRLEIAQRFPELLDDIAGTGT